MTVWTSIDPVADGDTADALTITQISTSIDELRAPWPVDVVPQNWTPVLCVNDANAANGYTPTTGSNPTLGTGSHVEGRYIVIGKMCFARATVIFGTAGVNPGNGPYRISLPVPTTTAANASTGRAPLGRGRVYDDSVAQATFGLGPDVYRAIDMHTAETIATDVAGLLNVGGLPIGNFQGNYSHSNGSVARSINIGTATASQAAAYAAAIADDLAALLIGNVLIDVAHNSPITFAANDRITLEMAYETP